MHIDPSYLVGPVIIKVHYLNLELVNVLGASEPLPCSTHVHRRRDARKHPGGRPIPKMLSKQSP